MDNEFPKTLQEAIRHFSDPEVCHQYLVKLRWPSGVACPRCGNRKVYYIMTRRLWQCKEKHQKRQFSAKVGTIFEDSAIPLDKWLTALWLIASAKNGISSYELHPAIGVTQKTAWFMLHRIRLAMQSTTFTKLGREVEVDETNIGGRARKTHTSRRNSKAVVRSARRL